MDHSQTVVVKVPPTAAHLAVLRTAVGGVAARYSFTLDQISDLRLAVEEVVTQMLRHVPEDSINGGPRGESPIEMAIVATSAGLEVRLSAQVDAGGQVIDESSFSWMILQMLADDVQVESRQSDTTVVLRAHRLSAAQDAE
ncbi:MAG: ATP-binding protein [Egibacteraceae bacterium]